MKIGGIDQWIQIRGRNEENPVLLWVNGGPGGSTIPDSFAYEPWEEHFTIVMWDQRGEGKTFEKYGPTFADTMTVERMSEDGIEVAEFLQNRFPKAKIVLLGHSWGSILGIHMARRRPDLFAAYVGTGQVTALSHQFEAAYPLLLKRAMELGNDEAMRELMVVGPPSVSNPSAYGVVNKWGGRFEPPVQPSTNSVGKLPPDPERPAYIAAGMEFSVRVLDAAITSENLPALGSDFSIPIYFFQGSADLITTTSAVRDYYDRITAPAKGFVLLENAGHFAIFRARDDFLNALLKEVRPLLISPSSTSSLANGVTTQE